MSFSHPVFVIEDDPAVRDSLLMFLRAEGFQARGFPSAETFFERLPQDSLACLVVDLRLPGADGTAVLEHVASLRDRVWPAVILTGEGDVSTAVRLMKAGAIDFLEKPIEPGQLLAALTRCAERLLRRGPGTAARLQAESLLSGLTDRERDVFDRLVSGRSNKEIAADLSISPRTVEVYRGRIMKKMKADTLPALVAAALALTPGD